MAHVEAENAPVCEECGEFLIIEYEDVPYGEGYARLEYSYCPNCD